MARKNNSRTTGKSRTKSPRRAHDSDPHPELEKAGGYDEHGGYAASGPFARPGASNPTPSPRRGDDDSDHGDREGAYPHGGAYGAQVDYARQGGFGDESAVGAETHRKVPQNRKAKKK